MVQKEFSNDLEKEYVLQVSYRHPLKVE